MCADRIQRFLEQVRAVRLLKINRLKEVIITPPDNPRFRDELPLFHYLVFNKRIPVGPEGVWYRPLTDEEIKTLTKAKLGMRILGCAYYPEVIDGWNTLNRLADVVLFGFNKAELNQEHHKLLAYARVERTRHKRIAREFVSHLNCYGLLSRIESLAIRGGEGRVPGGDLDLLLLVDDEGSYQAIIDATLAYMSLSESSVEKVSFLTTDFSVPDSHALAIEPTSLIKKKAGIQLDLYLTVGHKELIRVVTGDPIEARWNLEVLKQCKPLHGRQWLKQFINSYSTTIGLRAKTSVSKPTRQRPHAVFASPDTIKTALRVCLDALIIRLPRIEMWDTEQEACAFDSPFVAALIEEATADAGIVISKRETKTVNYLLATMEEGPCWRFAPEAFPEWPADVDDTVCALAALTRAGLSHYAYSTPDMLCKQMASTGLLYTWLKDQSEATDLVNDSDPIVTANAALLLHRLGRGSESLTTKLEFAVNQEISTTHIVDLQSLYYNRPAISAFFLARWAEASKSKPARSVLSQIADWCRNTNLADLSASEIAAIVYAAICGGADDVITEAITLLLAYQAPSGLWPNGPFCVDPGGSTYGSAEVTSSIAVTALARWLVNEKAVSPTT